jgi:hypothetical protein
VGRKGRDLPAPASIIRRIAGINKCDRRFVYFIGTHINERLGPSMVGNSVVDNAPNILTNSCRQARKPLNLLLPRYQQSQAHS